MQATRKESREFGSKHFKFGSQSTGNASCTEQYSTEYSPLAQGLDRNPFGMNGCVGGGYYIILKQRTSRWKQ
jgi:hypothetical protein